MASISLNTQLLWCEKTDGPLIFKCEWRAPEAHAAISKERLVFSDPSVGEAEMSISDQCKITLHNWSALRTDEKFKIMMQYYNHLNEIFDFIEKHCQEKK